SLLATLAHLSKGRHRCPDPVFWHHGVCDIDRLFEKVGRHRNGYGRGAEATLFQNRTMTLLLTLLPLYLFGNLHCLGMSGPFVMMIGKHRYRLFYFAGRTLSFTLAGALAGAAGLLLQVFLKEYHIPALASFFFAAFLLCLGLRILFGLTYPGAQWLSLRLA